MSERRRPTPDPSEDVRRGIARRYEAGESLEDLALDWEIHPRRLRDWISPFVEIRPKGYREGGRRIVEADGRGERPALRPGERMLSNRAAQGKRVRGKGRLR